MPLPSIPAEWIKKVAGETRFQRGLAASREASVKQLELGDRVARGKVDHHQVSIALQGEQLSGACDCEDSDGFDFCEHCVVLTLHANRQSQQRLTMAKGPDRSKVLAYLLSLEKGELAKQMLSLIEEDTKTFRQYLLKAALENKQIDYADLRRQVTALTRTEERLFSQRQVKHFFARIEGFLQELHQATPDAPERMLKVLDYLVQRLNLVLDQVDDRGGIRQPSATLLSQIHLRLFLQFEGRSTTLAKRYHQSWQLDHHSLLQHDANDYLDEQGVQHFINALFTSWEQVDEKQQQHIARSLYRLQALDLSREQSLAMRQLLIKDANDWISLAEDLVAADRSEQAIVVLQQAQSQLTQHEGLAMALARLYLAHDDRYYPALATLCADFPDIVAPLVFPELASGIPPGKAIQLSALQQGCFEALRSAEKAPAKRWCRNLYLAQHEGLAAWQLLQAESNPDTQALLRCAQLLQDSDNALALQIIRTTIEHLLSKERYTTDRQLAELLLEFPIVCDPDEKEALVQAFRPRILRRPAIVEALRQSERNSQLGAL